MGLFRKDRQSAKYLDYMFVCPLTSVCLLLSMILSVNISSNMVRLLECKGSMFDNEFHHQSMERSLVQMLETPPCVDFLATFIGGLSSSKSFPCGFVCSLETEKPWLLSTVTAHLPSFNSKSSFQMPCLHSRQLG